MFCTRRCSFPFQTLLITRRASSWKYTVSHKQYVSEPVKDCYRNLTCIRLFFPLASSLLCCSLTYPSFLLLFLPPFLLPSLPLSFLPSSFPPSLPFSLSLSCLKLLLSFLPCYNYCCCCCLLYFSQRRNIPALEDSLKPDVYSQFGHGEGIQYQIFKAQLHIQSVIGMIRLQADSRGIECKVTQNY